MVLLVLGLGITKIGMVLPILLYYFFSIFDRGGPLPFIFFSIFECDILREAALDMLFPSHTMIQLFETIASGWT